MQEVADEPVVALINSGAEFSVAIDEVISKAAHRIVIFDRDLLEGSYNTAQRFNRFKIFLLSNRRNRLDIALHKSDHLERDCARMMILLRQFPHAINIHRTLPEAQRVSDGFVVADGLHFVHRFHLDHPRGKLALQDEAGGGLLLRRFEEIWTYTEPAAGSTVLGL